MYTHQLFKASYSENFELFSPGMLAWQLTLPMSAGWDEVRRESAALFHDEPGGARRSRLADERGFYALAYMVKDK